MKKLLALLLAFMLPCCAFAETRAITLKFSTDDEIFAAFAKEVLQVLPGMTEEEKEKKVEAVHAILKDTKFTAVMQDDAISLDISLSGKPLLDMVVHVKENESYITTSMLPGYILTAQQDETQLPQNGPSQIDEAALNAIAASVKTAVKAWLSRFEPTVSYGSFQGDAYSGGTKCTTWVLSDKDIAELVSAIATDEVRAAVTQMLKESGADAVQLLQQFDALNAQVAEADAYKYILQVVHDGEDNLVGLSLTILEEEKQLATVSFGIQAKEVRLVIGLGLKTQNYWREYILQTNQHKNIWFLRGFSREWVANKAEAFSYVSTTSVPVQSFTWSCNISQSGNRYLWDAAFYDGITTDEAWKFASCNGRFTPASRSLEADFNLFWSSSTPLMKMQFSAKPAQEIPPLDDSLVICSASDPEDAALYDELNKKFSYELTRRLLTLLPLDVLLNIGE